MVHLSAIELYGNCSQYPLGSAYALEALPQALEPFTLTPDMFKDGTALSHAMQVGWDEKTREDFGQPAATIAIMSVARTLDEGSLYCNSILQYKVQPENTREMPGVARAIDFYMGLAAMNRMVDPGKIPMVVAKCTAPVLINSKIGDPELRALSDVILMRASA